MGSVYGIRTCLQRSCKCRRRLLWNTFQLDGVGTYAGSAYSLGQSPSAVQLGQRSRLASAASAYPTQSARPMYIFPVQSPCHNGFRGSVGYARFACRRTPLSYNDSSLETGKTQRHHAAATPVITNKVHKNVALLRVFLLT